MADPAVKLSGVRVTSEGLRSRLLNPSGNGDNGPILDGVSLELTQGETLSILGESGGGKSTLMRTVNRLVDAEEGSVEVFGKDVREWSVRELRTTAVYVPQRAFLFGGTVRDELDHALRWHTSPHDGPHRKALAAVALDVDEQKDAAELSEGQRHRLCIARTLMLSPRILMLDEPTGALDVRTARDVLGGVKEWTAASGMTLMVITHRPGDLSILGGDALVLLDGKVAGRYAAKDVVEGNVNAEVGAFFGSSSEESP